jgi:hypothetical protein
MIFGGNLPANRRNRLLEYLIAIVTSAWGLWLLNPIDSFSTSRAFDLMAKLAPESVWGATFGILGVILFTVAHCGGKQERRGALIVTMFSWIMISVFYYVGNPAGTAFIPYFFIAMTALIAYTEVP